MTQQPQDLWQGGPLGAALSALSNSTGRGDSASRSRYFAA